MKLLLSPLLLALAGATPLPVLADAHATLRLSNFGYSLIDLKPDDGIAPGVAFIPAPSATVNWLSSIERGMDTAGGPAPDWSQVFDRYEPEAGNFFGSYSATVRQATNEVSSATFGDVHAGSFGAVMDARATRAADDGLYDSSVYSFIQPGWGSQILLTPHTELVWTGKLSAELETDAHERGERRDVAQITASLWIYSLTDEAIWGDEINSSLFPPGTVSQERDMRLSFANLTDDRLSAKMLFQFTNGAATTYYPIPEPGTVTLMLAGLGVLGVYSRRRGGRYAGPLPMNSA